MTACEISLLNDQDSHAVNHREPYEPPTVTVVPLRIEERLLACSKQNPKGQACQDGTKTS